MWVDHYFFTIIIFKYIVLGYLYNKPRNEKEFESCWSIFYDATPPLWYSLMEIQLQLQNNLKYTKYAVDVSLIHFLMCLVHVERWYIIFFIIFKFNKAYYANISNVVNIWLIKFTVTALYIYCLISTLNLSVLLSISFYNLSWEMFYRI